jgi:hypothetical protein
LYGDFPDFSTRPDKIMQLKKIIVDLGWDSPALKLSNLMP